MKSGYQGLTKAGIRAWKNDILYEETTEEALKDIEPFDWSEDVLSGKTKVTFVLAEDTKKEP